MFLTVLVVSALWGIGWTLVYFDIKRMGRKVRETEKERAVEWDPTQPL